MDADECRRLQTPPAPRVLPMPSQAASLSLMYILVQAGVHSDVEAAAFVTSITSYSPSVGWHSTVATAVKRSGVVVDSDEVTMKDVVERRGGVHLSKEQSAPTIPMSGLDIYGDRIAALAKHRRMKSITALTALVVELESMKFPQRPVSSTRYRMLNESLRCCAASLQDESKCLKMTGRCDDSSLVAKIGDACLKTKKALSGCMQNFQSASTEHSKVCAETALATVVFELSFQKVVLQWSSAHAKLAPSSSTMDVTAACKKRKRDAR